MLRLDLSQKNLLKLPSHKTFKIQRKACKELLMAFGQSLGSETDVCPKFGGEMAKNWF